MCGRLDTIVRLGVGLRCKGVSDSASLCVADTVTKGEETGISIAHANYAHESNKY